MNIFLPETSINVEQKSEMSIPFSNGHIIRYGLCYPIYFSIYSRRLFILIEPKPFLPYVHFYILRI